MNAHISQGLTTIGVIAHLCFALSLPLLVSWDGHGYIRLAESIGSRNVAETWDYLRTPLYPIALRLTFEAVGKQAFAITALNVLAVLSGVLLIAALIRETSGRLTAGLWTILACVYPALIVYEHMALTESGTFFFLALIAWCLVVPRRNEILHGVWIAIAISVGFYFRQSLLHIAPVAGALYVAVHTCVQPAAPNLRRMVMLLTVAGAIATTPYVVAFPWLRMPESKLRINLAVLTYGIIKQGLLPVDHPLLGNARETYSAALERSVVDGKLPYGGLLPGLELGAVQALESKSAEVPAVFLGLLVENPARYLQAVGRTLVFFGGAQEASDTRMFAQIVSSPQAPGALIGDGPAGANVNRSQLQVGSTDSVSRELFRSLLRPSEMLTLVAVALLPAGLIAGIIFRSSAAIVLTAVPIQFLLVNALTLNSQDRMAAPAWPLAIAGLVLCAAAIARYTIASLRNRTQY